MDINDIVQFFKIHGNHKLVVELDRIFYTDEDLVRWRRYFENIGGFAQNSWYVFWAAFIKELDIKNFLDLGVHVGQFSILPALLGKRCDKEFSIHMVSPFSGVVDKYSSYEQKDYGQVFLQALADMIVDTCKFVTHYGLSQDQKIKNKIKDIKFDLMYIDGSHDYDVVKQDIEFYVLQLLKPGGIVIFDDANFYIPYGRPEWEQQGYQDVVRAVTETMDGNSEFEHLFDLTHNRIFRRNK